MDSKVDAEYKDISVEITGNIKNGLTSNRFRQQQISKTTYSIFPLGRLIGDKSKNKHLDKISSIKTNSDHERDCSNSGRLLHYQYFLSHRNVLCEYVHDANSFINEPQTIEFDLFNINFCPYCSNEFSLDHGDNV
jgi:hypothetical protein